MHEDDTNSVDYVKVVVRYVKMYRTIVLIGMPRRARTLRKTHRTATRALEYGERVLGRLRRLQP